MDQNLIKNIIDYAMSILEEKPETLLAPIRAGGVEKAVPSFISEVIKKVTTDTPEVGLQEVLGAIVGIFGAVDRTLIEGGISLPKELKLQLLSESVELSLQRSPSLHDEAMKLSQEQVKGGSAEDILKASGGKELTPNEVPSAEEAAALDAQEAPPEGVIDQVEEGIV